MPLEIKFYRRRIANTVIAPSTLRNQGAKGVADAARDFVASLDLTRFITHSEGAFCQELDLQTKLLKQVLPTGAKTGELRERP